MFAQTSCHCLKALHVSCEEPFPLDTYSYQFSRSLNVVSETQAKSCVSSVFHVLGSTANQNAGKKRYIHRYLIRHSLSPIFRARTFLRPKIQGPFTDPILKIQ